MKVCDFFILTLHLFIKLADNDLAGTVLLKVGIATVCSLFSEHLKKKSLNFSFISHRFVWFHELSAGISNV